MQSGAAKERVQAARTALVLDQPFFGALALRLAVVEDPTCKTAWVDGVTLGYSPSFVEGLTHAETVGLIGHEVMHCALGHPWRRGGRDGKRWNVACDHAVNPVLKEAGFSLPEGGLLDAQWQGRSAEWIFDRLPIPPSQDQGGQGKGQGSPQDATGQGGAGEGEGEQGDDGPEASSGPGEAPGEVRDAPVEAPDGQTEADWQQAVQQAAQAAKARGSLGAGLARFAKDAAKPRVDWRSVLRRFVSTAARADYSWTRPNPRYLGRGLFLPAIRSEEMGVVVVGVDTSGSIDDVTLAQFGAELNSIVQEMQPERVVVMYADAVVQRTDTFERGEPVTIEAEGGGGTAFAPVFEAVGKMEEQPVCVVYLTDGCGSFPSMAPDYPVLWALTGKASVPFGETVSID